MIVFLHLALKDLQNGCFFPLNHKNLLSGLMTEQSLALCLLSLHPPTKLDLQVSLHFSSRILKEGAKSMHQLSSATIVLAYIPLIRLGTRNILSCKGGWKIQSLFREVICPAQKCIMVKNGKIGMRNN